MEKKVVLTGKYTCILIISGVCWLKKQIKLEIRWFLRRNKTSWNEKRNKKSKWNCNNSNFYRNKSSNKKKRTSKKLSTKRKPWKSKLWTTKKRILKSETKKKSRTMNKKRQWQVKTRPQKTRKKEFHQKLKAVGKWIGK